MGHNGLETTTDLITYREFEWSTRHCKVGEPPCRS